MMRIIYLLVSVLVVVLSNEVKEDKTRAIRDEDLSIDMKMKMAEEVILSKLLTPEDTRLVQEAKIAVAQYMVAIAMETAKPQVPAGPQASILQAGNLGSFYNTRAKRQDDNDGEDEDEEEATQRPNNNEAERTTESENSNNNNNRRRTRRPRPTDAPVTSAPVVAQTANSADPQADTGEQTAAATQTTASTNNADTKAVSSTSAPTNSSTRAPPSPQHIFNQVNGILGNVVSGNISGIVDQSLGIRAREPVRDLVNGILRVVFCNPIFGNCFDQQTQTREEVQENNEIFKRISK